MYRDVCVLLLFLLGWLLNLQGLTRLDDWTIGHFNVMLCQREAFAAHMLRLESFDDMLMMLRLRCRWAYPVAYSFLWRRFSESDLRDSKYVFETASLKS